MRPEAKVQIYSKTYQQIKSLECEASLINSKELAEKENGEVADEKLNCKEKIGFVDWLCDKTYNDRHPFIFIAAA